jgi:hypothetical protein
MLGRISLAAVGRNLRKCDPLVLSLNSVVRQALLRADLGFRKRRPVTSGCGLLTRCNRGGHQLQIDTLENSGPPSACKGTCWRFWAGSRRRKIRCLWQQQTRGQTLSACPAYSRRWSAVGPTMSPWSRETARAPRSGSRVGRKTASSSVRPHRARAPEVRSIEDVRRGVASNADRGASQ